MTLKKPHVVSILNQKLTVRTDADDHHVGQVAGFVGGKIQEVMDRTKSASTLTAALLTCLNIADELFRRREGEKEAQSQAAKKMKELITLINLHLDGGDQNAL